MTDHSQREESKTQTFAQASSTNVEVQDPVPVTNAKKN
jgi:hypothetical protein